MIEERTVRTLWRHVETLHAVTYFADECRAAADDAGCKGFWMGYFGARAAPMGAVGAGVVIASFANFAPSMVERAVPDVWAHATPSALLDARARSAARVLRRLCPDIESTASDLADELSSVAAAGDPTGRPLFAANQVLHRRDDPVEALWQACTSIREHRGDGHVAALVAEELSGLDAHLLPVAKGAVPADLLREARGWSESEWATAIDGLVVRGIISGEGTLTAKGWALEARIESTTDRLAAPPWDAVADVADLLARLASPVGAIRSAGVVPIPNPIGLD